MLELFFTFGQAACALLIVYRGYLVLMSARKARPAPDDEPVFLRHLQNDA
jgi:hypothetical protein